jgi:hypothetical protein
VGSLAWAVEAKGARVTTQTDYSTLTDRELDALVAERVMGQEVTLIGAHPHYMDNSTAYRAVRRYSTDPAAAFTVLEAMAERGYTSTMCLGPPSFGGFAITISGPNRKLITEGSPDSMPRAAVIAALRALDVERS